MSHGKYMGSGGGGGKQHQGAPTPYIGCKISLISKLDIRYEGILHSVNAVDSTLALSKVRQLGTEDRNAVKKVAADDSVYEYIVFKASDIKDLNVCDMVDSAPLLSDPVVVSVQTHAPSEKIDNYNNSHRGSPAARGDYGRPMGRSSYMGMGGRGGAGPRLDRIFNLGQPAYRPNNNYRREAAPRKPLRFDSDYDIEKANEAFAEISISDGNNNSNNEPPMADGEAAAAAAAANAENNGEAVKEAGENGEENTAPVSLPLGYDKTKSFFDNISCEALEKADTNRMRPDWRKERQTNLETFGVIAVRWLAQRRGGAGPRGGGRVMGQRNSNYGPRGYNPNYHHSYAQSHYPPNNHYNNGRYANSSYRHLDSSFKPRQRTSQSETAVQN